MSQKSYTQRILLGCDLLVSTSSSCDGTHRLTTALGTTGTFEVTFPDLMPQGLLTIWSPEIPTLHLTDRHYLRSSSVAARVSTTGCIHTITRTLTKLSVPSTWEAVHPLRSHLFRGVIRATLYAQTVGNLSKVIVANRMGESDIVVGECVLLDSNYRMTLTPSKLTRQGNM